jgi:hypothetical protein
MIVWRGNGLVALIVVLVFNTIVNVIAEKAWGLPQGIWDIRNAYPWLWLVGMWPSAIFCWFYGKRLKEQAERDAVLVADPATGQTVRAGNVPELFWLPVQWWSVPCMVTGVWFWQVWGRSG